MALVVNGAVSGFVNEKNPSNSLATVPLGKNPNKNEIKIYIVIRN